MDNLHFYEMGREVPTEARKKIEAGRLKGFTDVNPMWRIKKLTEMFGPCGVGWWTENVQKEIVFDEITNQKCVFVSLDLLYVDPETGETTHPIHGEGGASMVSQERSGPYFSDECYKMAYTDALSVACKALGIGADVYFEKDKTKYTKDQEDPKPDPVPEPQTEKKATARQIELLAKIYTGENLAKLLHANGIEKIEDLSMRKASDLIAKLNARKEKNDDKVNDERSA